MALRTSLRGSPILTVSVLLFAGWTVLTALRVFALSESVWAAGEVGYVGNNPYGGVAGVVVLAAVLGLLVVLYGELSEDHPEPEQFPPRR